MPRAFWTPYAQSELDDILFQIAVRDGRPETAERIYFEIRDAVDSAARPDAARHVHPDAPDDWFYVLHKRWLIFYRLRPGGIEVQRVKMAAVICPTYYRSLSPELTRHFGEGH